MTKRNLKLIFEKIAFEYGFKKHRYMYIKEYDKFLLKISLQNILESNEYRFNCYFLIKAMNTKISLDSFLTADITGHEKFITDNGELEIIKLQGYTEEELSKIIRNSIDKLMQIIETGGITGYLKAKPEMISTIPMRSKEYLEREKVIERQIS